MKSLEDLIMSQSLPKLLFGGAIVFLGVGFLLDGVGVWSFGDFFSNWWPALIILAGLISIYSNPRMPLWPLFIISAGALLLLQNLEVIDVSVWQVIWPTALIVAGLSFVIHGGFGRSQKVNDSSSDISLAFSGVESTNTSDDYQGGKINVAFGGVELDLREATIKGDRARLEIFVAFGGIELRVPKEWEVRTSGFPLFGGWEDSTSKPTGKNPPVLEISGTCMFGGVEIKN